MNFSLESIRSKVIGEKILANGRSMAEEGRVILKDIAAVGSRETEIKGTVSGAGDAEETFDTKLVISDGNLSLANSKAFLYKRQAFANIKSSV